MIFCPHIVDFLFVFIVFRARHFSQLQSHANMITIKATSNQIKSSIVDISMRYQSIIQARNLSDPRPKVSKSETGLTAKPASDRGRKTTIGQPPTNPPPNYQHPHPHPHKLARQQNSTGMQQSKAKQSTSPHCPAWELLFSLLLHFLSLLFIIFHHLLFLQGWASPVPVGELFILLQLACRPTLIFVFAVEEIFPVHLAT